MNCIKCSCETNSKFDLPVVFNLWSGMVAWPVSWKMLEGIVTVQLDNTSMCERCFENYKKLGLVSNCNRHFYGELKEIVASLDPTLITYTKSAANNGIILEKLHCDNDVKI